MQDRAGPKSEKWGALLALYYTRRKVKMQEMNWISVKDKLPEPPKEVRDHDQG